MQMVELLRKEGTLTRKQIVAKLSIDNRRCYDIINVLVAVPPENPLVRKHTDEATQIDSYTLGDGNPADNDGDDIELYELSSSIKQEQRQIILLSYRISRIPELQKHGLNKAAIMRQLEEEEKQMFCDTLFPVEE